MGQNSVSAYVVNPIRKTECADYNTIANVKRNQIISLCGFLYCQAGFALYTIGLFNSAVIPNCLNLLGCVMKKLLPTLIIVGLSSFVSVAFAAEEHPAAVKHEAAAAAHEKAATHHKAAAEAHRTGKHEEAKTHAKEAEAASKEAHQKSEEAKKESHK
ncbi:MAG TPA: hypothetical protein VIF10_05060 [Methylobacter sp.]|jgi:hypothetical protein